MRITVADVVMITAISVAALVVFAGIKSNFDAIDKYKSLCIKSGGNPVWNGRNYECIQKVNK